VAGLNLNPFVDLVASAIYLYEIVVSIWLIVSWLTTFRILNDHSPVVKRIVYNVGHLVEPLLRKIRRYLPRFGELDISPVVLLLLLHFIKNVLYVYIYV
jgi:YggT family protein